MSNTSTFSLKLVKDFTFKEKFNLTHTQTDIMSYFVNLSSWAYTEGSGYYLAVTNKIMMDLDLQIKTVEDCILKLKKLNLIKVKCMLVKEWSTQTKHRYIAITSKGKTYQSVMYPSKDEKKLNDLEEENRLLKEKIKALEEEKEPKEPKKVKVKPKSEFENITQLRVFVTKKYAKNQELICNHVKGYLPQTAFYINNYNKLALITPDKNCIQIDNIEDSNNFWKFLFENQKSIGKIHKERKKVDISPLLKFIGEDFTLNDDAICTIKEIIAHKEGVEIYLMHPNKGLTRLVPRRINQLYRVEEAMDIFENNPSTSRIST